MSSLARSHDGKDDIVGGDDEVEKRPAKKARKTSSADYFLLLDRIDYEDDRSDDAGASTSTWTAPMVTSRGVRFQVSLRAEAPPAISRLLFKAVISADILTSYKSDLLRPLSTPQFHLIVRSSGDGAVLLEACGGGVTNSQMLFSLAESGMSPCTSYYLMDHLDGRHSPPASPRLQEMPPCTRSGCQMGMSLMRRDDDNDDSYVVAGLERDRKGWHVAFLSTSANVWRRKPVRVAPELRDCIWEPAAALACGGRFWWLDLQRGMLSCSCDSLLLEDDGGGAQRPVDLEFTLLPGVNMEQAKAARPPNYPMELERDMCVGVSDDRLRFVEVLAHRRHRITSPVAPPPLCDDCRGRTVTSWVMQDHSGGGAWTKEHTVKVADVWRDESYGSTGLPMEAPEFPLVHPSDPDVVYLSIINEGADGDGREFCVHLGTKQFVSSSSYKTLNLSNAVLEPVFTRRV